MRRLIHTNGLAALGVGLLTAFALAVAATSLASVQATQAPASARAQLKAAKAATARFRSVAAAQKAGYVRGSPCISARGGAEGVHFVNARLMRTSRIEMRRPEILIYEPTAQGALRLVALEYWKADADGMLTTQRDRPTLFGRRFDGPMAGHGPGMPVHYDLHVWLFKSNPRGLFTPLNPRASCQHAAREEQLGAARRATARYRSVQQAERNGYAAVSPCIPGEGIHYAKNELLGNTVVTPGQPELLIYEPQANGHLKLVALEYWKADADQNMATVDDRPTLFGRPFDGPMAGHAPGMPIHYDIHVWLWKRNPDGLFTVANPTIACPAAAGANR